MKEALDILIPAGGDALSFVEFVSVIKKVTNTINDRPLGVKKSGSLSDGEFLPITPNTLLLGRTSSQPVSLIDEEDEDRLTRRTKFVEECEKQWWSLWFHQVWSDLFPRNKWKTPSSNLKTGDICLKALSSTVGKRRYVLCRIGEVFPDKEGLVRTVEIWSRPRDVREPSLPYSNKALISERISVQRLVLVHRESSGNALILNE